MIKKFNILFLIPLFLLTTSDFISCQNKEAKPFTLDFTREAIILGSGSIAGITAFLILDNINPLTPEDISMLNPSDVNGFDRGAIGPFTEDQLGDALLYGSYLLPLTFLAYDNTNEDFLELALMYGQVLLVQGSINGIVKGTVLRTRPYTYDDNSPLSEKTDTKARISFFSGHTSITAAISFFTAKVFDEYIDNTTTKVIVWSAAALIPAVTAYSRVDNHWHFPTDVMVGYAFGAFVGYFIPELHKSDLNKNISFYSSMNFGKPMISIQIKF
jgi:membrane-associated phospholipid phosphatase